VRLYRFKNRALRVYYQTGIPGRGAGNDRIINFQKRQPGRLNIKPYRNACILFAPGRRYIIHPGIGDGLPHMFAHMVQNEHQYAFTGQRAAKQLNRFR
jgi:hypothetical protein